LSYYKNALLVSCDLHYLFPLKLQARALFGAVYFDYLKHASPENSQIMHHLASLLIPQEIFPQSRVIVDTRLLRKFPCEINVLRDLGADL
jgi:hypothetical protein